MGYDQGKLMEFSAKESIRSAYDSGFDFWCIGTGRNACKVIQFISEEGYDQKKGIVPGLPGSAREAKKYGIKTFDRGVLRGKNYVYIDGADQVVINHESPQFRAVIKGGPKKPPAGDNPLLSGCTYWEKKLAGGAKYFIVVVDESKRVKSLGENNYPVGVVFRKNNEKLVLEELESMFGGSEIDIRKKSNGETFYTNENMLIADISPFKAGQSDLSEIEREVNKIQGVESFGLFADDQSRPNKVILASQDGVKHF